MKEKGAKCRSLEERKNNGHWKIKSRKKRE
jgi:hypothetical protein